MGDGNKVEFLVAICALIASAMAVYIAWDQGRVMRAQQHGAVFPVLQVDGFVSSTPEIVSMGMRVSNSGVGPALIERVDLLFDGAPVDGFADQRARLPEGYDLSWSGLTGRALAPGEDILPVNIQWQRDAISEAAFAETTAEWGRFEVRICYCSVFDRCWRSNGLGTSRATKIKKCDASDTDVFESLWTSPTAIEAITPAGTE